MEKMRSLPPRNHSAGSGALRSRVSANRSRPGARTTPLGGREGRDRPHTCVLTGSSPAVKNVTAGMECQGCAVKIRVNDQMTAVAGGFAHMSAKCRARAGARLQAALEDEADAVAVEGEAAALAEVEEACREGEMAHEVLEAGHAASSLAVAEQRRAAERARKSGPERISIALRCLDGQCGRTEEHDMHCLGCSKGIHGSACLGASAGKILVGVFMCTECTLEETGVSQPSNAARAMAAGSMIEHIVAGSENFGKKMATTTRQIDKFLEFMGADGSAAQTFCSPPL